VCYYDGRLGGYGPCKYRPVTFVRRLDVGGEAPPAHLQDADEEQGVDPEHAVRHGEAPDPGRPPARVAEVERARPGVDPCGALDGQVRQDPVHRGERAPSARQQQAREAPDADEATRHAEVVEAEVVVALEPGDVQPVVQDAADPADLQQAHGPQRPAVLRPGKRV
jgi:hypothetical protein